MQTQVAGLVEQARQGDAHAFAHLYEQYAPRVSRFLRSRVGGSHEVAEDLTAEVFLKIWHRLDLYVERGLPFEAWVFRVARNCLIDYLRRLRARPAASFCDLPDVSSPDTDQAYGHVLDRQVVETALLRLGEVQRQTVRLRFLEGRSVVETAVLMGRTADAVKKLQSRALVNLKRLLSPPRNRIGRDRRIHVAV